MLRCTSVFEAIRHDISTTTFQRHPQFHAAFGFRLGLMKVPIRVTFMVPIRARVTVTVIYVASYM